MKKMTIVMVMAVTLVAAVFVGCKHFRGQILDGPGMERNPADYPTKDSVNAQNKETSIDGSDGSSSHALSGSKEGVEVDWLDIGEMPKTAVLQQGSNSQYAVYIDVVKLASGEGEMDAVKSVWLADERSGTALKVCVTNPMAETQWDKMRGQDADAVSVPLTQVAAADKAMIAPGDAGKVIVEGCPDGRNIWTYIIDSYKGTAKQLPSSEGVVSLDWKKKEIITASYGYDTDGRYSVKKVYSLDGKFLRMVGEKEREKFLGKSLVMKH